MDSLNRNQVWGIAVLLFAAVSIIITFVIEGDAQVIAYSLLGLSFAAFAVLSSNKGEKRKTDKD